MIRELIDSFEGGACIKDVSGDLPIHIAIEKKLDVGIISWLVKLYPECLAELGAKGRIPLNLAIDLKASDDIILVLLESYSALKTRSKYILKTTDNFKFTVSCSQECAALTASY